MCLSHLHLDHVIAVANGLQHIENSGTDKSWKTSALLQMFTLPEASKKSPVKTRLINQFFLEMYIKSAGMLPDKRLG